MSFIQYLEKCLCMDVDEGRGCDELNLRILKLCDSPELGSHYFHLEHLSFEPRNMTTHQVLGIWNVKMNQGAVSALKAFRVWWSR